MGKFQEVNCDFNACDVLYLINCNTDPTISHLILQAYFNYVRYSHTIPYLITNLELDSFLCSKRSSYYLVGTADTETLDRMDYDIIAQFEENDDSRASISITTEAFINNKTSSVQMSYSTEMISYEEMIFFELAEVDKKRYVNKKDDFQVFNLRAFTAHIVSRNKTHVLSQSRSNFCSIHI